MANTKYAGRRAGHLDRGNGYVVIGLTVSGRWQLLQAHRLAIALVEGKWPPQSVDHINGRKDDNRYENLRVCSHGENMRNQGPKVSGSNPFKGAYFHKRRCKWQSSICVNYTQIHLGYFDTAEEAHAAYCEAATKRHGEFANFGSVTHG